MMTISPLLPPHRTAVLRFIHRANAGSAATSNAATASRLPYAGLCTATALFFLSFLSLVTVFTDSISLHAQPSVRTVRGSVQSLTPTGLTAGLAGVPVVVTTLSGPAGAGVTFDTTVTTNTTGEYALQVRFSEPLRSIVARPVGESTALRPALQFAPTEQTLTDATALNAAEIAVLPFTAATFTASGVVRFAAAPALAPLTSEIVTLTVQLLSGTQGTGGQAAGGQGSVIAETTTQFVAGGSLQRPFSFPNVLPGRYTLRTTFARDSALQISPRDSVFVLGNAPVTSLAVNATPLLMNISGVVTYQGLPRPNTPVRAFSATSSLVLNTTTAADGSYRFTVATSGTYSVLIGLPGFPAFRTVVLNWLRGPASVRADLDAEPSRYLLSGSLQHDDQTTGFVPRDATVNIRALSGVLPSLDTTVSTRGGTFNGELVYAARLPSGRYQITPTATGIVFAPTSTIVEITDRSETIAPGFRSTPRYQTITGVVNEVTNGTVRPVVSYVVSLSSIGVLASQVLINNTTATTNLRGEYTFRVPFSNYIVFLNNRLNPLYQALPPNNVTDILINGTDRTLQPLLVVQTPPRSFALTGLVTLASSSGSSMALGAGLDGVRLQAVQQSNGQVLSAGLSSSDGRYVIGNVTSGTYTIRPSLAGFAFTPSERVVPVNDNAATVPSFTATLLPTVIAGQIATIRGEAVEDVPVRVRVFSLNSSPTVPQIAPPEITLDTTIRTNFLGNYFIVLANLLPKQRVTVTPSPQTFTSPASPASPTMRSAMIFGPAHRVVIAEPTLRLQQGQLLLGDQNFRTLSTTAGVRLGTISGTLVPSLTTVSVAGAIVTDGTRSAVTDAEGRFTIQNVPNGRYTLSVLNTGTRFRDPGTIVVSNLQQQRTPLTIVAFSGSSVNRSPTIERLPGNPAGTLRTVVGRTQLFRVVAADADADDALSYSAIVEDPTIARARFGRDSLVIDPLSEGNTAVTYIVQDNQGGFTTATFRVYVEPAPDPPTIFVRKNPFNTNHNAAFVITREAVRLMIAQAQAAQAQATQSQVNFSAKDLASLAVNVGEELAAINSNDECVGSVRLSGEEDVLTIWSVEPESSVEGLLPNTRPRYELAAIKPPRRTRASVAYLLADPGPAPVDRATIVAINEVLGSSVQNTANPNGAGGTSVSMFMQDAPPRITPNPTTGDFALDYALVAASSVTCDLLNIYGQRVETLVSADQIAGHYRVRVSGEGLPSGVYLCRLQAGTSSVTLRVVIAR